MRPSVGLMCVCPACVSNSGRFIVKDASGTEFLNNDLIGPSHVHLTVEGQEAWSACAIEYIRDGLERL